MIRNWDLWQGDTLLAHLRDCSSDPNGGPVCQCRLDPQPAFEEVRPEYDKLRRALDEADYESLGESIQSLARLQHRLVSPETDYVWMGFWLLLRGDEATIEP